MSRPGQNSRYRCVAACVCVCAEAVCHEMCFTSGPKGALTSGYVPSLLANPPPTLQKTPEKNIIRLTCAYNTPRIQQNMLRLKTASNFSSSAKIARRNDEFSQTYCMCTYMCVYIVYAIGAFIII